MKYLNTSVLGTIDVGERAYDCHCASDGHPAFLRN